MFRNLSKKDLEKISDQDLSDETNGTQNYIDTCHQVESECELNEEEGWFLAVLSRLLRKDFSSLKYEQSRRKKK